MPVVALSILGLSVVPESRDSRKLPLDLPGALLVTSGSLAVVYGIIQGGESGWTSGQIVGSLVAGGALLLGFVAVELRSASPMLPLQYFKRMDFTGSFLVLMLLFVGMIGVFFFLTQFLQLVQGHSALVAGLAITPVAAAMIAGAVIATQAVPRFGPKATIVVSALIVMAGMRVFTQIEVSTPYWVPVLGIMLFGLGTGIAMPTVTGHDHGLRARERRRDRLGDERPLTRARYHSRYRRPREPRCQPLPHQRQGCVGGDSAGSGRRASWREHRRP